MKKQKNNNNTFFDKPFVEFIQTTKADDTPATIRGVKLSN